RFRSRLAPWIRPGIETPTEPKCNRTRSSIRVLHALIRTKNEVGNERRHRKTLCRRLPLRGAALRSAWRAGSSRLLLLRGLPEGLGLGVHTVHQFPRARY